MTGTPNFEGIVGTLAAVDYLADLAGNNSVRRQAIISSFNAIRAHENALSKQFLGGIHRLAGWRVWGIVDPNRLECRVSTFGITHRKHDPSEIASALADQGIFVWHGHFYAVELIQALGLAPQGMVRAGFLHYNTADEVARLLETLARFDA